LGDRYGIQ
jgi:hypothetical protein